MKRVGWGESPQPFPQLQLRHSVKSSSPCSDLFRKCFAPHVFFHVQARLEFGLHGESHQHCLGRLGLIKRWRQPMSCVI
jgi:hypothetical protein